MDPEELSKREAVHMLGNSVIMQEDAIFRMFDTSDAYKEAELNRIEQHAHELREKLEPDNDNPAD